MMIHLKKLPKPKILVDNAAEWTKLYCDCISSGKIPDENLANKYKHPTIKKALETETHGKCAYCESKIKHTSHGDVEHIFPKNKNARPDLYVDWDNLTLSCEQCNRSGKRTYYNIELPLINPYSDDPDMHFQAVGPLVYNVLGDDRAFVTEQTIKLNRPPLITQRIERIDKINVLLSKWQDEKRTAIKAVLENQLHEEYGAEKEFSFVVKWLLATRGFPINQRNTTT
jgi:hypothetical protein